MAKQKVKPQPDNPEQSRQFIKAAKEHDADETGVEFERALEKIVPPKKPPKG